MISLLRHFRASRAPQPAETQTRMEISCARTACAFAARAPVASAIGTGCLHFAFVLTPQTPVSASHSRPHENDHRLCRSHDWLLHSLLAWWVIARRCSVLRSHRSGTRPRIFP